VNYRPDIDGLRSIAVLAVVLFHLDLAAFEGGFVGVDVFFVISGFLITSLIVQRVESGSFTLKDFYLRRIRRLIPPLIATVAVTSVLAAWLMTPYDFVYYARSAVASLFSVSNILFFAESGYWDSASELKPLLHTWSLGVEEQFYLFWPALTLFLFAAHRRVKPLVSLALVCVGGFFLTLWVSYVNASAAFYLLPFRVFQFAAGALLLPLLRALPDTKGRAWLALRAFSFWLGLAAVLAAVMLLDEAILFPGWSVLLPTVGTALMLFSGQLGGAVYRPIEILLSNPVSVWLGRVSYSMYLVHWPVIVLYRYEFGLELDGGEQLLLAALTLAATCVLHYGIERRFYLRGGSHPPGEKASGGAFALRTLAIASLVAVAMAHAWGTGGWQWRYPTLQLSEEDVTAGLDKRMRDAKRACHARNFSISAQCDRDATIQVLVFGNSVVLDGYHFLQGGYGDSTEVNVVLYPDFGECARNRHWRKGWDKVSNKCQEQFAQLTDAAFLAPFDAVFYSANRPYDQNKQAFVDVFTAMKEVRPDLGLVTFGGYINTERDCAFLVNRAHSTDACSRPENVRYFASAPETQPLYGAMRSLEDAYVDRVSLLCKNRVLETCLTRAEDGTPVLYDQRHMSVEFSEMSGRMYAAQHPRFWRELVGD